MLCLEIRAVLIKLSSKLEVKICKRGKSRGRGLKLQLIGLEDDVFTLIG